MDLNDQIKMQCCLVIAFLLLWFPVVMSTSQADGHVFTKVLKDLARDSLGVDEIQDYLDNDVKYRNKSQSNGNKILETITNSMHDRFVRLFDAVQHVKVKVEEVLNNDNTFTSADTSYQQYEPCAEVTGLSENQNFPNLTVNMDKMCVIGPGIKSDETRYPVKDTILEVMKANTVSIPELKWQYIGFEQNYVINYPATRIDWSTYEPRHRSWYKDSASPILKDIVLVFDKSRAMQPFLIQDGEMSAVLHTVINTMGPKDRIGLVAFDKDALTPEGCYSDRLALCIPVNIDAMEGFVNTRTTGASTESAYSKAFHRAFQYFINSPDDRQRDKVILFMSDGRATDNEDQILNTISQQNAKLNNEVIIHTFGIGQYAEEAASVNLMTNIAQQIKYNKTAGKVASGEYRAVSNAEELREIMAASYNRPAASGAQTILSGPYHDGFGFGIVYSGCAPIHKRGNLFMGVVCIDILMRDLVEDLTSYPCFQHANVAYTFMLDSAGRYVYHPLLPLSVNKNDEPVYADFCMLERGNNATTVRDSMIRQEKNFTLLTAPNVSPRGTTQEEGIDHKEMTLRYYWGPIGDTGFSVCVVLDGSDYFSEFLPSKYPDRVLYHRTDLTSNPPSKCNDFNRIVFRDNATVVLTVNAFRTPGRYFSLEKINSQNVSNIEEFLQGGDSNSMHIKDDARDTVATLYDKLQNIWKEKSWNFENTMSRYVGTREGVFLQMPGVRYPHPYDHTKRKWYSQTIHSKNGFAVIGPYKDAPSGLMIVTLSKTLILAENQILGVAAIDFSLNHLYHQFVQAYKQCSSEEYVCTIIDDSGMVVLHQSYIDNPKDIPADNSVNRHIVMMEPDISRELKRQDVITVHECFNSKTIKNQNFYKVEVPKSRNRSVDGEFFTLHEVPGTNIFLIIKKSSHTDFDDRACHCLSSGECYSGSADCPCPCHSTAQYDYCENQLPNKQNVPLPCYPDAPSYQFEDLAELEMKQTKTLPLCYNYDCSGKGSKLSCEGVFSCTWCEGTSCKAQAECATEDSEDTDTENTITATTTTEPSVGSPGQSDTTSSSTPLAVIIGGAAAGVIVAVVVIVLAVILCKKKKKQSSNRSVSSGGTYMYPPSSSTFHSSTISTYVGDPDYMDADDVSTLRGSSPTTLLQNGAPPSPRGFINPGMVNERPLPATPVVVHIHPDLYQEVRESSTYSNAPPRTVPEYLRPEPLKPPDVCPGIKNSLQRSQQRKPSGQLVPGSPEMPADLKGGQGTVHNQKDTVDATSEPVDPYYNSNKRPNVDRPLSTDSSIGYGQTPVFQNADDLKEITENNERRYDTPSPVQELNFAIGPEGLEECPSPTYMNAAAELEWNSTSFRSDSSAYEQVPKFENADVFDELVEDKDASNTKEAAIETTNATDNNKPSYINEKAKFRTRKPLGTQDAKPTSRPKQNVSDIDTDGELDEPLENSEASGISYVNVSSQRDARPVSTVSSVADYGTAPKFENEVFI